MPPEPLAKEQDADAYSIGLLQPAPPDSHIGMRLTAASNIDGTVTDRLAEENRIEFIFDFLICFIETFSDK